MNTNIIGTCKLLEAVRLEMMGDATYKPIIHICASSEVFGKIAADKIPSGGINEECPFDPASPYAISKVGTDLLGRYYADVRDAVRAYFMLVTMNPVPGEYYNIGGSYSCEVGDTLNTLISYSSIKEQIKIEVDPARLRPIDADLQIPDCRKFKEHTGWEPEIPFEKTMHDLLD